MALKKISWIFLLIAVALPHISWAASAFNVVCDDDHVVAYRYGTDFSGKPLGGTTVGWTEGEKFGGPWTFVYDGGDVLLVDGKKAITVFSNGPVVVAVDPYVGPSGAGVWSYAIHTKLQMVVATQVNGSSLGKADGIKVRSVSFQCTFMK